MQTLSFKGGGKLFAKSHFVVLALIFAFGLCHGEEHQWAPGHLNLRQVITNPLSVTDPEYVPGRALYPNYSYEGLPDNFLIKNTPDLSFSSSEIESIRINRMRFAPPETYRVTVTLCPLAGNKLYLYTRKNVDKKVALGIDDDILVVATILEPTKNQMVFTIGGKTIEQLTDELTRISKNVTIDSDFVRLWTSINA